MKKNQKFVKLLKTNLHPVKLKLDRCLFNSVISDFIKKDQKKTGVKDDDKNPVRRMTAFLTHVIEEEYNRILSLDSRFSEFNKYFTEAATSEEKKAYILEFAKTLGAKQSQIKKDKQAFSRWFGHDTITERYQKQVSAAERKIAFCLERLSILAPIILKSNKTNAGYEKLWHRFRIEKVINKLIDYKGDVRVRIEAFRCLANSLKVLPAEFRKEKIGENIIQYTFRAALDKRQNIWIQCEALKLLEEIAPDVLETTLKKRLKEPSGKDDIFVRACAVKILGNNIEKHPSLHSLFENIIKDPAPYVRQTMVNILDTICDKDICIWLPQLALYDKIYQIRASGLLKILDLIKRASLFDFLLNLLCRSLEQEKNSFVLRTSLKVCNDALEFIILQHKDLSKKWYEKLIIKIENLHCNAPDIAVRRWAAQTREKMWCKFDPTARKLYKNLIQKIKKIKPGKTRYFKKSFFKFYDQKTFGRVLDVINQDDFGSDVKPGIFWTTILRGHKFDFRLWRFIHEFQTPSPDKRQAFDHTTGRIFSGTIHSPSAIMSELTPTKVPGEPLFITNEGGWRPYLPLVDEILSSLNNTGILLPNPTRIYTSEGITEIRPSGFFIKRWYAKILLAFKFSYYANLRNWEEADQKNPDSYIKEIRKLGFHINFKPYSSKNIDSSVTRFFSIIFPFAFIGINPEIKEILSFILKSDSWTRLKQYFFSVYENTIYDLAIFAGLISLIFLLRNFYLKQVIRKVRKNIPLVIGGWGTRGKSSVERLKGGLINALGYSVLSKTTGCEAMFLHGHAYAKMREMFLFRPYDKATIWEQHNLACLANKLNCDVFLWECMGLTPSYVRILQREWMHDDLSTITNTYPDHEDLQGPAGINIPQVMTNFIPKSSALITTEEQMLPILKHACNNLNTRPHPITWLEAGLITPDIMERFPYEEHPYNVALVLGMAEELGIDKDFALKEMADHVIPDIGMLKVYPAAPLRSRMLEFVSGNSANERFGTMSNWKRTGFDKHDPEKEPNIWITTVVNNRADRIPRSKVFASILVEDISADRHFLIGSNLSGLQGYINEAWEKYAQDLTLWQKNKNPCDIFKEKAYNLRIPVSKNQIETRLYAMLKGQKQDFDINKAVRLWKDHNALQKYLNEIFEKNIAQSILKFLKQDIANFKEYENFYEKISRKDLKNHEKIDADFRELLGKWFKNKIIVIWDFHASGNQIINKICEQTPPGLYNRIMGLQNIKGTGLDFVYSWQRWERCYNACNLMQSDDPFEVTQGLKNLNAFQEYNILCKEYVKQTIKQIKKLPVSQNEKFQADLNMIMSNLENAISKSEIRLDNTRAKTAWPLKILEFIEAFQDAGDAVKRRKTANKIYKDLADERISHERAAMELQALNKRQKGGWLLSQFNELKQKYKKQL